MQMKQDEVVDAECVSSHPWNLSHTCYSLDSELPQGKNYHENIYFLQIKKQDIVE